jgi:SAM-dependent methyltransferase
MVTTQSVHRECGDESVDAGRGPGQLGWYSFARRFVQGKHVLDAGCGLGHGLRILQSEAAVGHGQDLDPRLEGPDIQIGPLEDIDDKSYDVVVSIDVVEHIEDDTAFLNQLARIAREGIFLTTPNWTAGRCTWPYHIREYTPRQFEALLGRVGEVTLYKGIPSGDLVFPVRHPRAYHRLNSLRVWKPTSLFTMCLNHLLPVRCRIHSHNAAWVRLR